MTRPIGFEDGCNLKQRPLKKYIIATASHGFHIFHAQTENLSLKNNNISIVLKSVLYKHTLTNAT